MIFSLEDNIIEVKKTSVREATKTDSDKVINWLINLSESDSTYSNDISRLESVKIKDSMSWFNSEYKDIRIIVCDEVDVGFYHTEPFNGSVERLCLTTLYIDPSYRNQGVGTKVLEIISKNAKTQNYKCIELNVLVNNPASKLYSSIGFQDMMKIMTLKL